MFPFSEKLILVAGGNRVNGALSPLTELLNVQTGKTCLLPSLTCANGSPAGFNFKGYPTICGGHAAMPTLQYDLRCFRLNRTSWVQVN